MRKTRDLITPPTISAGTLAASPQPVLAGSELVLRPWADGDVEIFLAAYRDPAIQQWHPRQPGTAENVRVWFARYRQDWALERGGHWAITRDGTVLGRIAMRGFDFDDGLAGCAYWVLPEARGAGVAPAALTVLSDWGLGAAGFHRLHLSHSTRNPASCRVATKAGFVLEGTSRSEAVHADGRHDMHLHARIRADQAARS
ncbi:RimJ/RimL family protein N-acetyltransferase [Actinoplanes tereljensis]|uniref:Acetyltransferase n=1 Tax=Paractinoplanes tereljensis TaxID=571912 RepID=A0A919TU68_9ACTN|nr:GNAT family N-acetyltransferase [Actinoplanes tereljensis]GIF22476.1 acetyltransferase [Actinoplanes tereljensis]